MKRPFEGGKGGDGPSRKGRKGEGGGGSRTDVGPCVLKFLAPEILASAVIGKGGAVIKQMREDTKAKIALSEKDEYYPGTDCRIITASANSPDDLNEFAHQLIGKVAECTQAPTAPAETIGTPDELKLRTIMPRVAVGGLIGKGGATIKRLREQSGANIRVADSSATGPGSDQVVTISGTVQALETVLQEANTQVQALGDEDWFMLWAGNSGAVRGGGGGYSGGSFADGYDAPPSRGKGKEGGKGFDGGKGGKGDKGDKGGKAYDKGKGGYESLAPLQAPRQFAKGGSGGPMNLMMGVARELPPYVLEDSRGFAMSCVVPNRLVGGLIGRGGCHTKEVQAKTDTTIGIREIPGDADNRSLNIAGPLANTCAAYMLMMKRYLDVEADVAMQDAAGDGGKSGKGGKGSKK